MSIIAGTNQDDTINGSSSADLIIGGNGNDTISGGAGSDLLLGGNGQDTIDGGAGADILLGGNGNDTLNGGDGSDLVFGEHGNDTATYVVVDNFGTINFYDGGNGFDTLVLVLTQAQYDEMIATSVFADFAAIAGTGTLFDFSDYGFSFDMNLIATRFEEIEIVIAPGANQPPNAVADSNSIDEDGVPNTVIGNVLANDTDPDTPAANLSVVNAGVLIGLYGTLTLNADGSYSYVLHNGDSAVNALNNGDQLQDVFTYTVTDGSLQDAADLTITINGNTDPALFTTGNDTVTFNNVVAGTYQNDTQYNALDGNDLVFLPTDAAEASEAGYVIGTAFNAGGGANNIIGGDLDDTIIGGSAFDRMEGRGGNDTLLGNAGNDALYGGLGDDFIDGGAGAGDLLSYEGATGSVTVNLSSGTATGADGNDTITGIEFVTGSNFFGDVIIGDAADNVLDGLGGNDTIYGGLGNDVLRGRQGGDLLDGGAGLNRVDYSTATGGVIVDLSIGAATGADGNDTIANIQEVVGSEFDDLITGDAADNFFFGLNGNDTLATGAGRDGLDGGDGNDILQGGEGEDFLTGGVGNDQFVFRASWNVDTALDFQDGSDLIDLRTMGFTDVSQLSISQVGPHTEIDFGGGDKLILQNLNSALLTNSDFLFV